MFTLAWDKNHLLQRIYPKNVKAKIIDRNRPMNHDAVFTFTSDRINLPVTEHGGVVTLTLLAVNNSVQGARAVVSDMNRKGNGRAIVPWLTEQAADGKIKMLIRFGDGHSRLYTRTITDFPHEETGCCVYGHDAMMFTTSNHWPLSPLFFMRFCELFFPKRVHIDITHTMKDNAVMTWHFPEMTEDAVYEECDLLLEQLKAQYTSPVVKQQPLSIMSMLGI